MQDNDASRSEPARVSDRSESLVDDSENNSPLATNSGKSPARLATDDDKYATKKVEVKKTDSKTGIVKRVFSDIKLTVKNEVRESARGSAASLDMMYSNAMNYTFIPARVAKELNAIELGEIDFGETAPPRPSLVLQHAYFAIWYSPCFRMGKPICP